METTIHDQDGAPHAYQIHDIPGSQLALVQSRCAAVVGIAAMSGIADGLAEIGPAMQAAMRDGKPGDLQALIAKHAGPEAAGRFGRHLMAVLAHADWGRLLMQLCAYATRDGVRLDTAAAYDAAYRRNPWEPVIAAFQTARHNGLFALPAWLSLPSPAATDPS